MIPLVFSNLLGSKFSENLFLKAVKPPGNSASVRDSILSTGGGGKIGSTDLDLLALATSFLISVLIAASVFLTFGLMVSFSDFVKILLSKF